MKEFTFICVCYNQEDFITEHLESIKQVIKSFGTDVENDLIIADDCSKDRTYEIAQKWIEDNRELFRSAEVLPKEANMGTVKNIYRAVDNCKTEEFKILAGDDKYNNYDIYSLYDNLKDEIIVTPILPFGNFDGMEKQLIQSFKMTYLTAMAYNDKNKLDKLLIFRNYLFAPGVFTPSSYWRDSEVRELLSNFVYIEDIPMWMKLIYDRKTPVKFEAVPYVSYRVAAKQMLSAEKSIDIREADNKTMLKIYPQRLTDKRKYLRPKYYKHVVEKAIYSKSKRYDDFFNADSAVKKVYIDMTIG